VQTVEPWQPPETFADLSDDLQNRILDEINAGMKDGNRYTDAAQAADRAAWQVVKKHAPTKTEVQAREIVKTWVNGGQLVAREYTNPATRRKVRGLWVEPSKRPGTLL